MIQFYDRINSNKGFVDLHIHTNDSYGDEMDKMNLTPEDLLESCYQYSITHNNAPATFAITDHNSIDGVKKVDLLIKSDPQKYKNMHFITGCEFTCSGGSLGTFKNDEGHTKNIVKNFHMLAYGFNPFDDDLNFLCKLHSTRRNNSVLYPKVDKFGQITNVKISAGAYVLAIKNIMKDHGFDVSIKEFRDVNLTTRNVNDTTYINYLITYIEKFNLPKNVMQDIEDQLKSRNIIHLGRLDCMEVMEIVENAGGYCVLAHPYLLELAENLKKDQTKATTILQTKLDENKVSYKQGESLHTLLIKFVATTLKNNSQDVYSGQKLKGIVGIEVLHSTSTFDKKHANRLIEIAENNNLYMTVGGDSHGTLIKGSMLSAVLYKSNVKNKHNPITVIDNYFANTLLSNNLKNNLNCSKSFDDQIKLLQTEENVETPLNKQALLKILNKTKVTTQEDQQAQAVAQQAKIIKQQNLSNENNKKFIEHSKKVKAAEKPVKTAITHIKNLIVYTQSIIDANNLSKSSVIEAYEKMKTTRKNIKFSLKSIEMQGTLLKDSSAVKYLYSLVEQYNKVNASLKAKYPYLQSPDFYTTKSNNQTETK